jgi:hypothetical protein
MQKNILKWSMEVPTAKIPDRGACIQFFLPRFNRGEKNPKNQRDPAAQILER